MLPASTSAAPMSHYDAAITAPAQVLNDRLRRRNLSTTGSHLRAGGLTSSDRCAPQEDEGF
jgi:hypothetical protein